MLGVRLGDQPRSRRDRTHAAPSDTTVPEDQGLEADESRCASPCVPSSPGISRRVRRWRTRRADRRQWTDGDPARSQQSRWLVIGWPGVALERRCHQRPRRTTGPARASWVFGRRRRAAVKELRRGSAWTSCRRRGHRVWCVLSMVRTADLVSSHTIRRGQRSGP